MPKLNNDPRDIPEMTEKAFTQEELEQLLEDCGVSYLECSCAFVYCMVVGNQGTTVESIYRPLKDRVNCGVYVVTTGTYYSYPVVIFTTFESYKVF